MWFVYSRTVAILRTDRPYSNNSLIFSRCLSNLLFWMVPFGFPKTCPCLFLEANASLVLRLIKSLSNSENNEKSVNVTFEFMSCWLISRFCFKTITRILRLAKEFTRVMTSVVLRPSRLSSVTSKVSLSFSVSNSSSIRLCLLVFLDEIVISTNSAMANDFFLANSSNSNFWWFKSCLSVDARKYATILLVKTPR